MAKGRGQRRASLGICRSGVSREAGELAAAARHVSPQFPAARFAAHAAPTKAGLDGCGSGVNRGAGRMAAAVILPCHCSAVLGFAAYAAPTKAGGTRVVCPQLHLARATFATDLGPQADATAKRDGDCLARPELAETCPARCTRFMQRPLPHQPATDSGFTVLFTASCSAFLTTAALLRSEHIIGGSRGRAPSSQRAGKRDFSKFFAGCCRYPTREIPWRPADGSARAINVNF